MNRFLFVFLAGAVVSVSLAAQPQQPARAASGPMSPPSSAPEPMPAPMPPRDLVQAALDRQAPLTADEVRQLLQELGKRNRAGLENHTGKPPAKPVTSVETLDLSPGATPPVVRVAPGQGAVLSFADAAGRPWPIADDLNFNSAAYEVKLIAPHLYTVALKQPAGASLSIVLKDLPRPVVVTVIPAGDEVDYLKEFTVPRFLGNKPPTTVAVAANGGALAYNASELLDYLYRTPPKQARQLAVVGMPGVLAWQNSTTTMVVRTAGLLVIPAWKRRHASTDGMAVYEVPLSPVVTVAQDGIQHRLSVSGFAVAAATH